MDAVRPKLLWVLVLAVLAGGFSIIVNGRFRARDAGADPPATVSAAPDIAGDDLSRLPAEAGQPHRQVLEDGRVLMTAHQDASGRAPLTVLQTPEGEITIQRTFDAKGDLLEERAFLDGAPIPVPDLAR